MTLGKVRVSFCKVSFFQGQFFPEKTDLRSGQFFQEKTDLRSESVFTDKTDLQGQERTDLGKN